MADDGVVMWLDRVSGQQVETTRTAPAIVRLLGRDPDALQAVRIEHTAALPLG